MPAVPEQTRSRCDFIDVAELRPSILISGAGPVMRCPGRPPAVCKATGVALIMCQSLSFVKITKSTESPAQNFVLDLPSRSEELRNKLSQTCNLVELVHDMHDKLCWGQR